MEVITWLPFTLAQTACQHTPVWSGEPPHQPIGPLDPPAITPESLAGRKHKEHPNVRNYLDLGMALGKYKQLVTYFSRSSSGN